MVQYDSYHFTLYTLERNMPGVNHCRLHCRLAKSRGLRRRGKYGAVSGQETRFFVCAQYELPGYGFLSSQSQRRIFPFSSNHGISPNDSVNYSGCPLPEIVTFGTAVHTVEW